MYRLLWGLLFFSPAAYAEYSCHMASQPQAFESFSWDGEPFQHTFAFRGEDAIWRVQEIGLPGHPELMFEVKVGNKVLIDMSQAKWLADYVFSWRSDVSSDQFTIVCRRL